MLTTQSDRRLSQRLLAAVLSVFTVATFAVTVAQAGPAHADVSFDQKMLDLVNQQRSAAGIAPLQWSDSLGAAAEDAPYSGCGFTVQGRAMDMGVRNYFSHTILGCLTQNVFNLLGGLGIVSSSSGENISWMSGTTDYSVAAQRLMTDLMNSPDHRANILNPTFTQIGIGSWHTAAGQTWSGGGTPLSNVWITAQIFGKLATPAPTTTSTTTPVPATTTTKPAAPAAGLSPTSLAFGDKSVGTTSPTQAVTVTNQGNAIMSVSGSSIGGTNSADFAIAANSCGTVGAGASCTLSVAFAPKSSGSKAATLQLSDNAAGSPQTVSLSGNGTALSLPDSPVNVLSTGGDGKLGVSWSPAATGPTVDGYAVNLWDASGYTGKQQQVCPTCLTSAFTGLANGKQYYVTVYGHDTAGWSNPAYSAWTTVAAAPGAPTNVQATQGNGVITANWVAPTTPGAAIDGYGAFLYEPTGFTGKWIWVCATCTTASFSGLTNGHSYLVQVFPHNPLGWGSSAVTPWVLMGAAGAPTNIVATPGSGQVSVTWTASPGFGSAIDEYGLFAFDAYGNMVASQMTCGTCTSGTVTGLVGGRAYTIWVYPHSAMGWGTAAPSKTVTVG